MRQIAYGQKESLSGMRKLFSVDVLYRVVYTMYTSESIKVLQNKSHKWS